MRQSPLLTCPPRMSMHCLWSESRPCQDGRHIGTNLLYVNDVYRSFCQFISPQHHFLVLWTFVTKSGSSRLRVLFGVDWTHQHNMPHTMKSICASLLQPHCSSSCNNHVTRRIQVGTITKASDCIIEGQNDKKIQTAHVSHSKAMCYGENWFKLN